MMKKYKLNPLWWLYKLTQKNIIPRIILPGWLKVILTKFLYEGRNQKKIDLDNPKTFTEKIVWYKLFYDNPEFEKYICKIKIKDFVKDTIGDGHTAKLYGAWTRVEDIDWDSLPHSFVIKSNCSSFGRDIIFVDNKDDVDFDSIKPQLQQMLDYKRTGVNSLSRGYYYVTPMIMAEELLGEIKEQPVDYKIFCFDGVPTYAYSAYEHFADGVAQSSKIALYDTDWNVLPVSYKNSEIQPVEKPKHFAEMLDAAAKLSKGLPFVRVDFYDTDEKIYVGEMTFYSGGLGCSFNPESFDFEMGEKFVLPKKTKAKMIIRKDLM